VVALLNLPIAVSCVAATSDGSRGAIAIRVSAASVTVPPERGRVTRAGAGERRGTRGDAAGCCRGRSQRDGASDRSVPRRARCAARGDPRARPPSWRRRPVAPRRGRGGRQDAQTSWTTVRGSWSERWWSAARPTSVALSSSVRDIVTTERQRRRADRARPARGRAGRDRQRRALADRRYRARARPSTARSVRMAASTVNVARRVDRALVPWVARRDVERDAGTRIDDVRTILGEPGPARVARRARPARGWGPG
jgi:hypothetical protein